MTRKFLRRMGALFLAAVLLLTPLSGALAAETQEGGKLLPQEVMAQPDTLITRGAFIMLVNTLFMLEAPVDGIENFTDVPDSHPYAGDILCAKAIGYISGDGSGRALPDAVISGAEAAAIVNAFLGFDASKVSPASQLSVPGWAVPSASVLLDLTMVDEGLINKTQLTAGDALMFLGALAVATMFPGSPYSLTQADPQDDFFAHVNRQFLATATVPGGYMYAASFNDASVEVERRQQDILSGILTAADLTPGSDEWKIKELYSMYMDNAFRTESLSKVQPYLDEIRAAESIDELLALAKKYAKYFTLQPFYALSVTGDVKVDATQWCAVIMPSTLDLGSWEYYAEDESLAGIQQAYTGYIGAVLEYIGETEDIEARVDAIFETERERADIMPITSPYADPQAFYHEVTWEEMLEITATTQTLTYMDEVYALAKDMTLYCPGKEYVTYVESLYTEENLQMLKDHAMLNVLSTFSMVLGDDLGDMGSELMTALYGETGEDATLEQRAQSFVALMMSPAFSRMYAETYGTEEIKSDMTEIVESIRDKYRERILSLTWMGDETKKKAVEKLDAIKAYVAYPDEPIEAVSYEVKAKDDGGSLIDLLISMSDIGYDESLNVLKQPIDQNMWNSVPTSTVNAFYSPEANAVIIPLGILQEPFYSPDATREENLGGIGAVIAHEFTHAFDTTGAQFDKDGTLANWWLTEDYEAFGKLTGAVAEELSEIAFVGETYVNGALCVGETIADLGAMACVLDIADDVADADLAKVMEAWASVWAARMSPELAVFLLYMDSHAPNKVRVNFILAQADHFYEVFDVTEDDDMYCPEEQRLKIW